MRPKGGGEPSVALKQRMEASFGSVDASRKGLAIAAMGQFGSGWGKCDSDLVAKHEK